MITRSVRIAVLVGTAAFGGSPVLHAAEPASPTPDGAAQAVEARGDAAPPREAESGTGSGNGEVLLADRDQAVLYVPPRRGAPVTRVGGGTRSGDGAAPLVLLLSPEHTGLTARPAPTLYWFLSRDYEGLVEVVVTARDAVQPLLRERVRSRLAAGFHPLDLAAHGVTLDPERLYQWSVSLVRDEQRRSRDVVAVATIERVSPPAGVPHQAGELAGAGLWYDAIDLISEAIPQLPDQRRTRADLLDQVGLSAAAAWDRRI